MVGKGKREIPYPLLLSFKYMIGLAETCALVSPEPSMHIVINTNVSYKQDMPSLRSGIIVNCDILQLH
jgi:hypothetical protein